MTAEIIQFIPKPNPDREKQQADLKLQANQIALDAFPSVFGIDVTSQDFYENGPRPIDYVAPEKDPA